MTRTTASFAGPLAVADAVPVARRRPGPSLLARLGAALQARRRRRAEAAVARLIRANGGMLTDELERRIAREHLLHGGL